MKLKTHILILGILATACVLRFWNLANNPPHLTSDEAALGYNAYSILKTGNDEHGQFLPIIFESFGDWKPGLYVYLDVPFVATLGLNEFSVRAPSSIFGVLAVYLLYLVVSKLFKDKTLGLVSALFLSISPWHIHFSRGAWEANISLTITLAGIYFFLRSLEGHTKSIYLSAILFGATLWTYQGAKLSTALVLLSVSVVYFSRNWRKQKKHLIKAFLFLIVVSLPVGISVLQGKAGRLEVYSVLSYPRPQGVVENIMSQDDTTQKSWQYVIYHSETLNFARGILGRWANNYSPRFLFFEGDWTNPRHGAPDVGVLLFLDSILLILGMVTLVKSKNSHAKQLIFFWLLASPLPAALSRDSVHSIRSFNMVIPLTVLVAMGALCLWDYAKRNSRFTKAILTGFFVLYLANYTYYLDQYWVHFPVRNAKYFQHGYKQAVKEISSKQATYNKIVFQQSYNQPYIFFLFYQNYDPAKFQILSKEGYQPSLTGDVGLFTKLDNIEFRDSTSGDLHRKETLIVYDPEHPSFPELSVKQQDGKYQQILRPDGSTSFELLSF